MSADASTNSNASLDEKNLNITSEAEIKNEDVTAEPVLSTVLSPNGKIVYISDKVDEAMKLAEEAKEIEVTPEEDRKLRWKIDYCMFPLMCILYAVQFMDKISTSQRRSWD